MGKVVQFYTGVSGHGGDLRAKLLDTVGDDQTLRALISKMDDKQIIEAFERTKGSLLAITNKLQEMDSKFAKFMATVTEETDSLLIVTAAINYVVDFCSRVPKQLPHGDTLDNAYQVVIDKEIRRVIERALRGV